MRKSVYGLLAMTFLLGVLLAPGGTKEAFAQVHFDINIGPPPIVVAEPPAVVYMPDYKTYFVPNQDFDVFFYNNYWWSPRGDRWYRARAYNGPWGIVKKRHIPSTVYRIPKNYRNHYVNESHIPYGQWKKQGRRHDKAERRDNRLENRQESKREDRQEDRRDNRRDNRRDDRRDNRKEHGNNR